MGGATVPVLHALGIGQMKVDELEQLSCALDPCINQMKIIHCDRKYLRPLLVRNDAPRSPCMKPASPMSIESHGPQSFEVQLSERSSLELGPAYDHDRDGPRSEGGADNGIHG